MSKKSEEKAARKARLQAAKAVVYGKRAGRYHNLTLEAIAPPTPDKPNTSTVLYELSDDELLALGWTAEQVALHREQKPFMAEVAPKPAPRRHFPGMALLAFALVANAPLMPRRRRWR